MYEHTYRKACCVAAFVLALFSIQAKIPTEKIMAMKHVCKLAYSVPLTSWSEALLLLLLVDVLPLSRLAGLEANWKMRR